MREKIYEDDDIVILAKRDIFIGEEADLGDTLVEIGLINLGKFSTHLAKKSREDFWKSAKQVVNSKIEDVIKIFE